MTATLAEPVPVELVAPGAADHTNPDWHKQRAGGIGASEIAAVLGFSPWESPFGLYWRKVHGWILDDTDELRAGRLAEPVVAAWFAEEHPEFAVRPAGLYAHPERLWERATPDRLLYKRACLDCDGVGTYASGRLEFVCPDCGGQGGELVAGLECKYVIGGWDGWGDEGTDDVPVYYRAQCLQQLDVLGVDRVYLAAWHGADFRWYLIRRDERDLRIMHAAGEAFMGRLAAGDVPPLDGHDATRTALKRIHPSIEDRDIEVPAEFAEGYRRARALARRAGDVLDRYEARARDLLGNGRRLVCNGHLVCSRSIYDQSTDMAELDSLDADPPTVDRLNPGRAASYLTPKGGKR
jgi:putative phage-type endonuclease